MYLWWQAVVAVVHITVVAVVAAVSFAIQIWRLRRVIPYLWWLAPVALALPTPPMPMLVEEMEVIPVFRQLPQSVVVAALLFLPLLKMAVPVVAEDIGIIPPVDRGLLHKEIVAVLTPQAVLVAVVVVAKLVRAHRVLSIPPVAVTRVVVMVDQATFMVASITARVAAAAAPPRSMPAQVRPARAVRRRPVLVVVPAVTLLRLILAAAAAALLFSPAVQAAPAG